MRYLRYDKENGYSSMNRKELELILLQGEGYKIEFKESPNNQQNGYDVILYIS